ncbi:hypothetical protein F652_4261 [Enterobacteriaceae bacterium bta3-1]|nr:hypothetical protein F652_4261 [Enterobacteriaceae bacterium bta3-1]
MAARIKQNLSKIGIHAKNQYAFLNMYHYVYLDQFYLKLLYMFL